MRWTAVGCNAKNCGSKATPFTADLIVVFVLADSLALLLLLLLVVGRDR